MILIRNKGPSEMMRREEPRGAAVNNFTNDTGKQRGLLLQQHATPGLVSAWYFVFLLCMPRLHWESQLARQDVSKVIERRRGNKD